jgi:Arc/MetJ family transcription regulator
MRTTIKLDADVNAAIEQLRQSSGLGVSETVNSLIRRGLGVRDARPRFVQRSQRLGLRIDVANVAEALELLDGTASR